jgi:Tol biopolymer transport system component
MVRSVRVVALIFLALCICRATAGALTTNPVKLNGPFPPGGGASFFKMNPLGTHVIYLADQETDGVFELYRVPVKGGTSIKLNGSLVTGGEVMSGFVETSDGLWVVYRADLAIDESVELYSVRTSGGPSIRLNTPLIGDGSDILSDFVVSPDGSRVIYRARPEISGIDDLYSVLVCGGTPVKLNDAAIITDGIANGPIVTPDSQRVIYCARRNNSIFNLYSVAIGGGSSIQLNGPLVTGGRVFDYTVTPDGTRVIYTAEQDTDGVLELYSVPVNGGAVVKLNASLPVGGNVSSDFQVTPDSSRVVYLADQDINGIDELYSVPVAGAPVVKLNGLLVKGGMVWNAARAKHFQITPDSTRVVYLADQDIDEQVELYSVPVSGGSTIKLNGALPAGGDVDSLFNVTPDSLRVIYRADQSTDGIGELYSVAVIGSPTIKLNASLPVGGQMISYQMPPGSKRILYTAEQDTAGVAEIYSVPVTGGFPVKLTPALVSGGDVSTNTVTADGSRLIYLADQEVDGVKELFSVGLVPETYTDFDRYYGLTTPADGDEDHDGNSNMFEYLCAGNPLESDRSLQPVMIGQGGVGGLWFVLARADGDDVQIEVETSTDLSSSGPSVWTVVATRADGIWSGQQVDLVRMGNGLVRHSLDRASSDFKRFYRLKATRLP